MKVNSLARNGQTDRGKMTSHQKMMTESKKKDIDSLVRREVLWFDQMISTARGLRSIRMCVCVCVCVRLCVFWCLCVCACVYMGVFCMEHGLIVVIYNRVEDWTNRI